MQCPKCNHFEDASKNFCTQCGESLSQRVCPKGHPIPAGISDCPYCPKKTIVETHVAQGTPPAQAPAPKGGGRAGTMVVGTEKLPNAGRAPAPMAAAPASGKRGKTMVVGAAQSGTAPKPSPQQAGSPVAGMISNKGDSPLAGFLVSFSTDKNGLFWPLRFGRTALGCAPDNNIVLNFPDISGQHAFIHVRKKGDANKVWISDQDSMNGTMLNGEDICTDKPTLSSGDVVTIGDVEMRVVLL